MTDLSIAIDCMYPMENLANATSFRKTTLNECRFSKSAGFILLVTATVSLIINIHFLIITNKKQQVSSRDQKLVIGMFISSTCVILISTPSVIVQCFRCHRLCSEFFCRLEGFNSFFHGCTTMYILVALSVVRYATTANSSLPVQFQHKLKEHGVSIIVVCFLMGSIWAIPPMFGRMSSYVPEGLGFHCGLNWFDRSLAGRVYFFLLFLYVYFIPMLIIIYVNIYIQRTIYRLTHLYPGVLLEMNNVNHQDFLRSHFSKTLFDHATQRLCCLYEDRRFAVATRISFIMYLISWTPYGVIALTQVFGGNFSIYKPWIMTTSALLAKISMIINPIIFTIVIKSRETTASISNDENAF